jgi:nucleotide-binding universal stress UspA family protein
MEEAMIKDIMVPLDGSNTDDLMLSTAGAIEAIFHCHIVGLFLNVLPDPSPPDPDSVLVEQRQRLAEQARARGDCVEKHLAARIGALATPGEIRRFDVCNESMATVAAREARSVDSFIALRPDKPGRSTDRLVEAVLFDGGRHVLLIPHGGLAAPSFDRVMIAWNGSREATRALAEAMPFLAQARTIHLISIVGVPPSPEDVGRASEIIDHLRHHGIEAMLHQPCSNSSVGELLIDTAIQTQSDLIVIGGYGHSRLREWLLGGVTHSLLFGSPIPVLISH